MLKNATYFPCNGLPWGAIGPRRGEDTSGTNMYCTIMQNFTPIGANVAEYL